ncbi:MAG: UDP-glucose/GDP-mannose dehydrogenase family protein [Proteobacteria bacterium]|nr:UDP-glucose/GDP-mannose dehydrogenase family protein [Pseudomonadota bacterium]
MNITVIGTGYVGLVTGACFSEMGNSVICVDVDKKKLALLEKGIIPIYEPGLEAIVKRNHESGVLKFSDKLADAMDESEIYLIAVGTPPNEDGSADLKHVLGVAKEIGMNLKRYAIIINKSTVPVGTAEKVKLAVKEELQKRRLDIEFDVVSNPEFLKEGDAVSDFMRPDRIIVGTDSEKALEVMKKLYASFSRNRDKLIAMGIRDAELTKYAANSLLATKISFMNEISNLCDRLNVDIENVRKGIGSDQRIGYSFIYPGCGYGGSCFPKDVKALIRTSRELDFDPKLLQAVEDRNTQQKERLFEKITAHFGTDLAGKKFGIWGLSFKPGTDDMREASSIVLIKRLIENGATVQAYDPVAMTEAIKHFPKAYIDEEKLLFSDHQYDALKQADAMVLVTEWKPFRQPDFVAMKKMMRTPVIFDGRNQYHPDQIQGSGFVYYGIGRKF